MNNVLKLAIASLMEHPLRLALTSCSTIASVCLVMWVVSGYDALLKSHDIYANLALGAYPLAIAPIDTSQQLSVPAELVDDLKADSDVDQVHPMWLISSRMMTKEQAENRPAITSGYGNGPGARTPDVFLLATETSQPPFEMLEGSWLDQSSDALEAVVRQDIAEQWKLSIGQVISVGEGKLTQPLKIVGLMSVPVIRTGGGDHHTPLLTPGTGEIFLSPTTAEKITRQKREISFLGVSITSTADMTSFRFGWGPRLSRYAVPVQFQESIDIEEALDESSAAANVQLQAYATTGIAMLVALLVILCTLSMGVTERIRQFAILRAICLTKTQIAMLIGLEGLLLGTIGFVGGLLLGQLLLGVTITPAASPLRHQAIVGTNCLLLTAFASYGGAILASLHPAWRATRVRPVDAMTPHSLSPDQQVSAGKLFFAGILLIAMNPFITFFAQPTAQEMIMPMLSIGFVCMCAGFVLIAPAIVHLVDRYGCPLMAKLFCLDVKLLTSQLSSHAWRTVGAAVSISVGMGLFVGVNVWGMTMLEAFIPGVWAPDALLAFPAQGFTQEHAQKVAQFQGVDSARCQPIVVEQPRLLNDLMGSAQRATITRQDNVIIVGVDLHAAFDPENPLFPVEWSEGTSQEVLSRATGSRSCIVPDHFLKEAQLKVGDSFQLVPPENPSQPVTYTIAGAAKLPGWHWQTKPTGFRSRTHRAGALVFADYRSVAEDFNKPASTYVWFSYDSPDANLDEITSQAQALFDQTTASSETPSSAKQSPEVLSISVEQVREMIQGNAARWIWMLSHIPLIAAGIACVGVINLMLASVRARRWEFGVIRAIGITRGSLIRVILAEGLLIGVVACLLSLGFGIMAGWCGAGYAQHVSFFGGLAPILVIPWGALLTGLGTFLLIVTTFMLWPAMKMGKTSAYQLMQQGRSTF